MAREAAGEELNDSELDEAVGAGLADLESEAGVEGADAPAADTEIDEPVTAGGADDEDDDLDDDLDDEDDDVIEREDGAEWNDKAGRWVKDGKFVEGAPPEGVTAPAAAAAPAKPGAAPVAGAAAPAAAAAAPAKPTEWTPVSVTVDRASVAIPEALMSRANGHVLIGIPDAKWPEFQSRIVKGIQGERQWRAVQDERRQLEEQRRLDAEKPPVKSDSEIEADILVEHLQTLAQELLTADEIAALKTKVDAAKLAQDRTLFDWERKRGSVGTSAATATREREEIAEQVATHVVALLEDPRHEAALADLTQDELADVVRGLNKIHRAVVWREGDKWMGNPEIVLEHLLAKAQQKSAASAGSSSTTGTSSAATPAPAGTTAAPASTRADRFNRAGETAAQPRTTNVKAGRTANGRPPQGHHRRRRDEDGKTPAQRAEDAHRKAEREWINSPSLEFEGAE